MFIFDVSDYANATKAMKSADTTAENKATPWARATLRGLAAGKLTIATMTATLCAAYQPKTKAGKAATTIGALPDSPRGRANSMKFIHDNIDVPGVRDVVEGFTGWLTEADAAAIVDALDMIADESNEDRSARCDAAVMNEMDRRAAHKDAPKTIAELLRAVKAAIKTQGQKLAGEPETVPEPEAGDTGAADMPDAGEALSAIAAGIRAMSLADVARYQDQLIDILTAIGEASARLADDSAPLALAA